MHRRLGVLLSVVSWLAIAAATLTPGAGGGADGSPWCLACGPGWASDMGANVLLFIPLGVGLALWGLRPSRALVAIAATTFAIELLQWRLIAGRDASLSDLLTNFAGGTLGYLAVRHHRSLLRLPPRRAALLALAWSVIWFGGTATTAWALSPSLPASLWWAHWRTPTNDGAVPPDSPLVLGVRLAGDSLSPGAVTQWPALRARLLGGAPTIVRSVLAADATGTEPDVMRVDDADSESDLVRVSRHGQSVSFYFRTRVAALRLRSPAIAAGNFLSSSRNDTVTVIGALDQGHLRIRAERPGRVIDRSLALSPNWGWSFLLPTGYAFGNEVRPLTALWVAALVLPIAYFASQAIAGGAEIQRWAAFAALALPALGLVLIPMLWHLPAVHWSEWLAWAAGSVGGILISQSRMAHA